MQYFIQLLCIATIVSIDVTDSFGQSDRRPVATYSIVARDSATGQMGVAVQSHWFSVGPIVPWAEAGVGAVATQSFVEVSYGPLGLDLMRAGRTAGQALAALVSTDEGEAVRQVAMVDVHGNVAGHTGSNAIFAAGNHSGQGFSTQANMMENPTVWDAMATAYEAAEGDLADRLLAALEGAEGEGGDIRGRQSAAILIVGPDRVANPWEGKIFDLRVEDHPDPVAELKRLVTMQRAYLKLNEGDGWVVKGSIPKALESYRDAMTYVSDPETNGEAPFWVGVTLADTGNEEDAIPYLKRAYAQDVRWAELIRRLPASGLLPEDPELMTRLVNGMTIDE